MLSAALLQIVVCRHIQRRYIETRDGRFYCYGNLYTVFPRIPDTTELISCPSQFFTEFPAGAFINKPDLLSIDVSNGSLQTLSRDTFKGANNLHYFNASHCNLNGIIPRETFCDHAPELRSIDLSDNREYIFTSAPFECLPHLTDLRIDNTLQICDPTTVEWIVSLREGAVIGNECDASTPTVQPATTEPGTTTS